MATNATFSPTGTPESRRKFQLTNLQDNNNKYYLVDIWPVDTEQVFFRATFGRVGAGAQVDEKIATRRWVERKIQEKLGKGYREVLLHRPDVIVTETVAPTPVEPRVQELVNLVYSEAGKNIASFLAVDVDTLSPDQIANGRSLLMQAHQQWNAWSTTRAKRDFETLAGIVQSYYNTIPTQLSSRIDRDQIVEDFCRRPGEQEDRLKQLEAAIEMASTRQRNPHVSLYDALGADIALIPQTDPRYGQIQDYVDRTCVHGYNVRVHDIFSVRAPIERAAFEQNSRGRQNVQLLFHGTPNQNVCHVLRTGLICPRVPSHGRMFGDGIYFANKCTKSANYCGASKKGVPQMLFLAEVALGRQYVARKAQPSLSAAPWWYDSVWGKAGHTGSWGSRLQYDEFIVYSAAQQSLQYLVTIER